MSAAEPDTRVLEFVEPMPGFDEQRSYALAPIDDGQVLWSMRSVDIPELRFVLTPPACFFADYAPEIEDDVAEALGARAAEEIDVLLVLTIAEGLADATANLRAPVVVCPGTGRAMQVVLDDESLPMRRHLLESATA